MMMMICYLERSLVVFICESITMMNNHHTVEIIWSLGWSTDNVMIVQFCAWYCYWATSDSHSVGELTQSFLGFFLWLMFLSMWPWKQPECNVCIDTWIGIECCDALCYMVWQNKRVLCEKKNKTKQNKTAGVTWPIVSYTTRRGWDGCSAMTSSPKQFHFLNALHSVHTWQHTSTPWNWSSSQKHIGFDTHETVPHTEGRVHGLTLTSVDDHPMTLTSTPSINQTHPLSLSFNPLNMPWHEAIVW